MLEIHKYYVLDENQFRCRNLSVSKKPLKIMVSHN